MNESSIGMQAKSFSKLLKQKAGSSSRHKLSDGFLCFLFFWRQPTALFLESITSLRHPRCFVYSEHSFVVAI